MRNRPPLPALPLGQYGLPLLSAILLCLAFYPARLDGLVWIALVPLLMWLAEPSLTTRCALRGLFLVGMVYHLTLFMPFLSLSWWAWGTTTQESLHAYFTYQHVFLIVLFSLIAAWGGVVLAGVGWLVRPALASPLLSCLVVPSAWVLLLEYLGHRTMFGFTWGLIGNRAYEPALLRQVASATGVYGLSVLVLWVNALLAAWGAWRVRTRPRPPTAATAVTVGLGLVIGWYGWAALQGVATPSGSLRRVALLQGVRAEYTQEDFTAEGLDRVYAPMIRQAARQAADIIILPETVWLRTLALDDAAAASAHQAITAEQLQRAFTQQTGPASAVVILGLDVASGGRTYNAMTFWGREGLLGVYHKQRLVPFAEYRPPLIGWLAPQNRIHGPQFTYAPGRGPRLIRAGGVAFGPFICQEVMFPELIRHVVGQGAEVLVTTGNDGVFRNPAVAREQAILAQFRAVESGRYLLRSMKSGISAIIDPTGRVAALAPVDAQAIVYGAVAPLDHVTLYTRFGDWIVGVCALILLCWPVATRLAQGPWPRL